MGLCRRDSVSRSSKLLEPDRAPCYKSVVFDTFLRSTAKKISELLSRGQTAWVILSRVEGPDSNYPEDKRIRAEILRDVADSYDPTHRRAPIVQAVEGITGRAHDKGELNPPIGWIEELSFDGLNLWARVRDVNGNLARHIDNGLVRGSVWIWPGTQETDGHWWLRHFALIAGQMTGTPGLPHLDEFFSAVEAGKEAEARSLLGRSYLARSIDFGKEEEMEQNEREALLRSFQEGLPGILREALKEERKEMTESILREVNEKVVAPLQAQLAEVKTASEAAGKSVAEQRIRSAVEQLSKDGKVVPAEVDGEVAMLIRATPAEVDARLALIGGRPAMTFEATEDLSPGDAVKRAADLKVLERQFVMPGVPYDKNELAIVRDLMAEAGGNHAKFEQLARERFGAN